MDIVLNMARTSMEFTAKKQERMKKPFLEILQEIHFVKTSINVEIGKIDAKLTKTTLDINDLKKNDKHSAEIHKSVIVKLELLTKT